MTATRRLIHPCGLGYSTAERSIAVRFPKIQVQSARSPFSTQNWWAHGAVSFIHNGGIPCRRGLRLDISTPSMTSDAPFEYSRTLLMVATHEEHRLSRSSRDSQTSTTKNCTPERHFYPTIVSRVDQKWLSGRMKAHSVRLTPVASGMSEGTGRIRSEQSRSAANIKIHVFWRPQS